jgi:hypothetical protein
MATDEVVLAEADAGSVIMAFPRRPRRHKRLMVPQDYVARAIIIGQPPSSFILRLACPGIPEDVDVEYATHDPWTRCIAFVLYHPSFPEVPDGCPPPDVCPGMYQWETVEIKTKG